ncbi:hypothetical protein COU56_04025 [Candidatus Pacearchaeota archaeon CG10_big_fil_rev_8_21_14_0_10_31_9]|nr:MAG: hypothetical protein COU56_04025 [Candidatus Pacearchaeota archaeon CG10_big_fil_rev_8_21_14_0_10_31_9]PIZ82823.1 MAG: hypothetical protein COX97_02900 [Candidatus Pacearchaeota archaeon CG_4_10_14_0_2_um_filter_05_32_18]
MKQFHIWDLEKVHVKINPLFLSKINKIISIKFKTKRKFYSSFSNKIPFSVFKNLLKPSYSLKFFIPLGFLVALCDQLNISKEELEVSILSYKSGGSVNYIINPVLPIQINPVFDMIYAHNIGDGTVSIIKNRLPYFAYRQFNSFYRDSYIKKIEYIFGNIIYNKKNFKELTRVRCPSSLSTLFFKYYKLGSDGFLSDTARISDKIFRNGKDSMLAVLIAFIIDEGNIDSSQISIKLKNIPLVKDLSKICSFLGYKHKLVSGKGDYVGYATLYILRDGMEILFGDYLLLNKKHSVIDLGFKGDKIKNSFNINYRKIRNVKGNRDLILSLLQVENISINQIADKINMTRQGVRYHINNLLKDNKIKIIDKNQLNWVYGV